MRLSKPVCAVLLLLALTLACFGQAHPSTPAKAPSTAEPHRGDIPDLIRETQLTIRAKDYSGLVWWIPFEFWIDSATTHGSTPEQAKQNFHALQEYTIVFVFAAKTNALGAFDFFPPEHVQKHVVIRDANGNEYAPVENVSDTAKNLAAMLKPILGNAMGKAGENSVLLFFPATGKNGTPIADAAAQGSFSVVLRDLVGVENDVYDWRLPLTSVAPAKFCPVGKERMMANWHYCPWHGVALEGKAAAAGK